MPRFDRSLLVLLHHHLTGAVGQLVEIAEDDDAAQAHNGEGGDVVERHASCSEGIASQLLQGLEFHLLRLDRDRNQQRSSNHNSLSLPISS